MLFVDFGVHKIFILAPCLNLNMMMESIFSFLPPYFSITFLAKGKISKSGTLFLSHIGPKWCWPIRLHDFKSNISLEQSDEIVYFFTCWYKKSIELIEKCWGGVARNGCGHPGHDEWMDKLSWFFKLMQIQERQELYTLYNNFWVAVVKNGHGTLIPTNG